MGPRRPRRRTCFARSCRASELRDVAVAVVASAAERVANVAARRRTLNAGVSVPVSITFDLHVRRVRVVNAGAQAAS